MLPVLIAVLTCAAFWLCACDGRPGSGTETGSERMTDSQTDPEQATPAGKTDTAGITEPVGTPTDGTAGIPDGEPSDGPGTDEPMTLSGDTAKEDGTVSGATDDVDPGNVEWWEDEITVTVFDTADTSSPVPLQITERTPVTGFIVHVPAGEWLNGFSLCCPSYSDNTGYLTLKLFRVENEDLSAALRGEPVCVRVFIDFYDNQWLDVILDGDVAKACTDGDYACVITDGKDEVGYGVGVWTSKVLPPEVLEKYARYDVRPIVNGRIDKGSATVVRGKAYIGCYWH